MLGSSNRLGKGRYRYYAGTILASYPARRASERTDSHRRTAVPSRDGVGVRTWAPSAAFACLGHYPFEMSSLVSHSANKLQSAALCPSADDCNANPLHVYALRFGNGGIRGAWRLAVQSEES